MVNGGDKPTSSSTLRRLSAERERFDRLLAEVKALQSGGPGEPPPPPPTLRAHHRRGWMAGVDVVVLLIVINALLVGTPLGAIARQVWAKVTNSPSDIRPLLSYFSQPAAAKIRLAPLQAALRRAKAARPKGSDKAADPLPIAVAFIFAEGTLEGRYFDVQLPRAGVQALRSVAVIWPGDAATAKQRQDALLQGLRRLRQQLGADEAAVAALAVDPDGLAFALQRAQVSGVENPGAFGAFGAYLTHEHRELAAPLVHGAFALAGAYSMAWPIEGKFRISSPFGMRSHPVLGGRRKHKGVDLAVPIGTPVRAIQAGRVVFAGADGVNGKYLRIDHGHGLTTTYCHLDAHKVARGQRVKRGAIIADSGNSGRSTGPHLHFQVELGRTPIDPMLFR